MMPRDLAIEGSLSRIRRMPDMMAPLRWADELQPARDPLAKLNPGLPAMKLRPLDYALVAFLCMALAEPLWSAALANYWQPVNALSDCGVILHPRRVNAGDLSMIRKPTRTSPATRGV
jgi:hypothetical protein